MLTMCLRTHVKDLPIVIIFLVLIYVYLFEDNFDDNIVFLSFYIVFLSFYW